MMPHESFSPEPNPSDQVMPTPSAADLDAVAGLSEALDRLAAVEQRAALPAMEERIVAASRRVIAPVPRDLAHIAASADQLAVNDQLAGNPRLEETAFELSREAVASGRFVERDPRAGLVESMPSLRLVDAVEVRPMPRRWWSGRVLRVAAAVALVASAAAWVLQGNRPTAQDTASVPGASVEELAQGISSEVDALLAYLETDGLETAAEAANPAGAASADLDTSWVDELLSRESL